VYRDPSFRTAITTSVLISIAYYVTAKVGFWFSLQPGSVSALWMPNSILLAGLLLTSKRWWWLVILICVPGHIAAELESGVPATMILCWFISNSFQAVFGAAAMRYFLPDVEICLDRTKHLAAFLVLGAFLAPFLASFLDAALVKLNAWGTNTYWELWKVRFLSNVLATLTLVPFILEWVQTDYKRLARAGPVRYLEALSLLIILFAVGYLVFNAQRTSIVNRPSILYWPLPFLLWATVRFGTRGVTTVLLLVMFMAILGATKGGGPFIAPTPAENAVSIQVFLILVSVPLLVLAAIIKERHLSEHALGEINLRNQAILRAIPDMMFIMDRNGVYLDYYAREADLLVPPGEFLGKSVREVLPPELAERIHEVLDKVAENDSPQVIEYSLRIGNEDRYYEARLVSADSPNILTIVRDITETRNAAEAIRKSEERLSESTRMIRSLAGKLITAQESERRRISLLLHDDVGQSVAAIGLTINRLKRKLPDDPQSTIAELDQVYRQLDSLTAQIRQLSHQLHPGVLEHLGLVKALRSHVTELSNEEQIQVKFAADVKTDPVPPEISVCIYRVALEALRNVSTHSGANSAHVTLSETSGWLVLEVSDSGKGFDVEKLGHGTGLGLASSEERVKLLHGSLEIRSVAQYGTRLTARVPLTNSR
jgi:PAS domain S-box-containing protein